MGPAICHLLSASLPGQQTFHSITLQGGKIPPIQSGGSQRCETAELELELSSTYALIVLAESGQGANPLKIPQFLLTPPAFPQDEAKGKVGQRGRERDLMQVSPKLRGLRAISHMRQS